MQNNNNFENRIIGMVVGGLTACVISLFMIGMLQFGPRHTPAFKPQVPPQKNLREGFYEKRDFMDLVETQGAVRGGVWNGPFVQYYPNGSILREMVYMQGVLEGEMSEYFEKPGYHRAPPKGRIPNRYERAMMCGAPKRSAAYRNGTLNGPYRLYGESGELKECGFYRGGSADLRILTAEERPDLDYLLMQLTLGFEKESF